MDGAIYKTLDDSDLCTCSVTSGEDEKWLFLMEAHIRHILAHEGKHKENVFI